ncbi:MAG: hypothetical protein N3I35_16005 [Clostridia bacterium]|nr:hypothetical protein [Clostridia bacterium]
MKQKESNQEEILQELIRCIVRKGAKTLDDSEFLNIAGGSSEELRTQLEAICSKDGCWCPDPPGGCRC